MHESVWLKSSFVAAVLILVFAAAHKILTFTRPQKTALTDLFCYLYHCRAWNTSILAWRFETSRWREREMRRRSWEHCELWIRRERYFTGSHTSLFLQSRCQLRNAWIHTPGISGKRTVFVGGFLCHFHSALLGGPKNMNVALLQCTEHVNQVAVFEQQTFINSVIAFHAN